MAAVPGAAMQKNRFYRLHGDERELTMMARDENGRPVPPEQLVQWIMKQLRAFPSVASSKEMNGVFVAHGHVYPELGELLEAACTDCRTPLEAARQGALLRFLLARAGDRLRANHSLSELVISQHNSAYRFDQIDQSTAGHFNISRFHAVGALMPDLGTFMCAMPLLSGGGGIAMRAFDFTASIRAERCRLLLTPHTQYQRGLVDAKEISTDYGSRQQLLGIDNVQSHRQTRAVYAVIHLFFCCIESRPARAPKIGLIEPIADMRKAIIGPKTTHLFRLSDGRRMTAAQILLTYLDWIRSQLNEKHMPAWAEAELQNATEIVTTLDDGGIAAIEGVCDYATLFRLWNMTIVANDLSWIEARSAAKALADCGDPAAVWKTLALRPSNIAVLALPRIPRVLKDTVQRYCRALYDFMTLAYEFGDIMPGGLYDRLTQTGITASGVQFGDAELSAALNTPPPIGEGRCHARAKAILELAQEHIHAYANWDEVRSDKRGVLKLPHVWKVASDWEPIPKDPKRTGCARYPFGALHDYIEAQRQTCRGLSIDEINP